MGEALFVTGGARSGKSAFAQELAMGSGRRVVFIATMEPLDGELLERVARHRDARPAEWQTVEAPLDLVGALEAAPNEDCVLLDCASLWVTNRLMPLGDPPSRAALIDLERAMDREVDALLALQRKRDGELIIVTNEVGSGVVPPSPLGRVYRDLLGRVNQRLSAGASRAWLLASGRALELPAPFGRESQDR